MGKSSPKLFDAIVSNFCLQMDKIKYHSNIMPKFKSEVQFL